jgi:hypothetical protein
VTLLAPRLDATLRRPGVVYGIRTLDPDTGTVILGYVGQTFQRLWQREAQHREDQPWSDLIVGEAFVIAQGWWTCAEIDEVEAVHIRALAPAYNYEHNLNNPNRVPIWLAQRQRAERDAVAGRPVWVPQQRRTRPHPVVASRPRRPSRRRWPRPARHLAWRAAVWLALTVVIFVAEPARVPFAAAVESSALGASLLMAAPLLRRRGRRRRRW